MMKIESVSGQPDRAGRYIIKFSDGVVMRLYRQTVQDFGLYTGKEITEDQLQALQQAAAKMSAKMRAVRIVTMTNVSKKDLEHRLIQKGEDPEQAREAVKWMADMELLDDRKTAEQIVSRCISKGYGLSRAKQALFEKRIPKDLWEDVLLNYPDQQDYIIAFLESRLSGEYDKRDLQKAVDALIRRGHSFHEIRHGLQKIEASLEEQEL